MGGDVGRNPIKEAGGLCFCNYLKEFMICARYFLNTSTKEMIDNGTSHTAFAYNFIYNILYT